MSTLQQRIREIRGDRSRREFSALLDVSEKTIERWEHAKTVPTDSRLLMIARKTTYRYEWIKDGEGSKRNGDVTAPDVTYDDQGGRQTSRIIVYIAGQRAIAIPLGPVEYLVDEIDVEVDVDAEVERATNTAA